VYWLIRSINERRFSLTWMEALNDMKYVGLYKTIIGKKQNK